MRVLAALATTLATTLLMTSAEAPRPPVAEPAAPGPARQALPSTVFFDDFDGAALDRTRWNVQVTGGPDAGTPPAVRLQPRLNNEQQAYVDAPEVVYLDRDTGATGARNGALALHPRYRAGAFTDDRGSLDFISGRITTQDRMEFTYGSLTARMKLPAEPGLWPAFWTLGADLDRPGHHWPRSGEIDVLENVGDPGVTSAGVWVGQGPTDDQGRTAPVEGLTREIPRRAGFTVRDWHDYRADWSPGGITFYVDNDAVHQIHREDLARGYGWAFDDPQFLLLNVALGGDYPARYHPGQAYRGLPPATIDLIRKGGGRTLIDWVRVDRLPSAHDRIEAEDADVRTGVVTGPAGDLDGTDAVGSVGNGDQLVFHRVDFGLRVTGVRARVAGRPPPGQGGAIELRVDSPHTPPFARLELTGTGGWNTWRTVRSGVSTGPSGVRTIFVTFSSPQPADFVNLNWFGFEPADPTGHWPLDGDGRDTSRRDSPLVTAGGPTWVDSRPGGGRALRLDGRDDAASTAGPVLSTDQDFTVSAWIRLADRRADRVVVAQEGTRTSGFQLRYHRREDRWELALAAADRDAPAVYRARSRQPPEPNRWTHLTGVFDSGARRLRLYVDGELESTGSVGTTWPTQGRLTVGRGRWAGRATGFFAGDIDDVRVQERALSAEEVPALAHRPQGRWTVAAGSRDFPTTAGPVLATERSFTVTAWVRLDSAQGNHTAVAQDGQRGSAFSLGYHHEHQAWAFLRPTADVDRPTLLAAAAFRRPTLRTWTHLAGSYDAARQQLRLWVDGEPVATTGTPAMGGSTGALTIGRSRSAGQPAGHWPGEIREVRAYSGVLDAGEITAMAAHR
ncbi:MAG TPA: LamG-like jellyroll fold domain-containing protein [Catenuloplanes sp.]|jgi:beta-glucanase (GH16 family)